MNKKGQQAFLNYSSKLIFLLFSLLSIKALSQACFPEENLPKIFQASANQSITQFTAVTGSDSLYALFIGGSTTNSDLNNSAPLTGSGGIPALARVDLTDNRYKFFKTYQGTMVGAERVTAVAVNSIASKVAAVIQSNDLVNLADQSFLLVVNANDGGYLGPLTVINHGQNAPHQIKSNQLLFAPDQITVFMSFTYAGTGRNSDPLGLVTGYAGKHVLGAFDSASFTMNFYQEQLEYFGYSNVLLYVDGLAAGNLYQGGSTDVCKREGDPLSLQCWAPSIYRFHPTGQVHSSMILQPVPASYFASETDHPIVDHMHLDVASNKLFGTTSSIDKSNTSNHFAFWTIELNALGNPITSTFIYQTVSNQDGMVILGVRPILFNQKLVTAVVKKSDGEIAVIEQTFDKKNQSGRVYLENLLISNVAETVYLGSKFKQFNDVFNYESYTATSFAQVTLNNQIYTPSALSGIVIPNLVDSEQISACMLDKAGQKFNYFTTNELAATLTTQDMFFGPCQLAGCSIDSNLLYKSFDVPVENIDDAPQCNVYSTVVSEVTGGVLDLGGSQNFCSDTSDQIAEIAFTPFVIAQPSTCTDPASVFSYQIEQDPLIDATQIKVSVDSVAGVIRIQYVSVTVDMSLGDVIFPNFFLKAILPNNQVFRTQFGIAFTVCAGQTLSLPATLPTAQLYYVTQPAGTQTVGEFTSSIPVCTTINYQNQITPQNTWITGISDSNGIGRTVSWQTDVESNKGIYTVTVVAQGVCSPALSTSFQLEVKSQCFVRPFLLDDVSGPNPALFPSPAIQTNIYAPTSTITFTDVQVLQDLICGVAEYSFFMGPLGTPLLPLFSAISTATSHSFSVLQTNDPLQVGIYDLIVKAKLVDYPDKVSQKTFTVAIDNICQDFPTFVPPVLPDQEYYIIRPALVTTPFADFTPVRPYCPLIGYDITVSPPLLTPNSIQLNSDNTFTIFETTLASEGSHTVTVYPKLPDGSTFTTDVNSSATFVVDFKNPCPLLTFTIDQSVFSGEPILYTVTDPQKVELILDTKAIQSETLSICPTDWEFRVLRRNLAQIDDIAALNYDSPVQTLTIQTDDPVQLTSEPLILLTLQVKFVGAVYSWPQGSLDFSVSFLDPCLTQALVSPAALQTNPVDYFYDFSPNSIFTLNPFTIDPVWCVPVHSCTGISGPRTDMCNVNFVDSAGRVTSGTFSTTDGTHTFSSTDIVNFPVGVYEFQIQATVGVTTSAITYQLTIKDPCPISKLSINSPDPFVDQSYSLRDQAILIPWDVTAFVTSDTQVDCGPIDLIFYDQVSGNPLDSVIFRDDRSNSLASQFVVQQIQDVSKKGVYQIGYRAFLSNYSAQVFTASTDPFEVTIIDPCENPTSLVASTLSNQEYIISDVAQQYTIDAFVPQPAWCDVSYSYQITELVAPPTNNNFQAAISFSATSSLTFTFYSEQDLSLSGATEQNYLVIVTASTGSVLPVISVTTFNLLLKNPCVDLDFTKLVPRIQPQQTYVLKSFPETKYSFNLVEFEVTPSICGKIEYFVKKVGSQNLLDQNTIPVSFVEAPLPTFSIYSEDISLVGPYELSIEARLKSFLAIDTSLFEQTILTINILEFVDPNTISQEENLYPSWMTNLIDQEVQLGDNLIYIMGEPLSPFDTEMTVTVIMGQAAEFVEFDQQLNMISISKDALEEKHLGTWSIIVEGSYQGDKKEEVVQKTFKIRVYEADIGPILEIEEEQNDELLDEYPVIYIEDVKDTVQDRDQLEEIKETLVGKPKPFIIEINKTGLLKIGWNKVMVPPSEVVKVLPPAKIFISEANLGSQTAKRRLSTENNSLKQKDYQSGESVTLTDKQGSFVEGYRIYDALELKVEKINIENGESQDMEVEWELVNYDQSTLDVQLKFDKKYTQQMKSLSAEDLFKLRVTFWDPQYFKDKDNNYVPFRTTLYWSLLGQLSLEDSQMLEYVLSNVKIAVTVISTIFVFLLFSGGPLLPFWMFLNSISLIAHLPLLKTDLPSLANHFLVETLNTIRLHLNSVKLWLNTTFKGSIETEYQLLATKDQDQSQIFIDAGYRTNFLYNILPLLILSLFILTIVALVLTIWILIKKDKAKKDLKKRKGQILSFSSNASLRFFYEIYLELALSSIIALQSVENQSLIYLISSLVFLSLAGILVFLIVLLVRKGPYLTDFYQKNQLLSSFWHIRYAKLPYKTTDDNKDEKVTDLKEYSRNLIEISQENKKSSDQQKSINVNDEERLEQIGEIVQPQDFKDISIDKSKSVSQQFDQIDSQSSEKQSDIKDKIQIFRDLRKMTLASERQLSTAGLLTEDQLINQAKETFEGGELINLSEASCKDNPVEESIDANAIIQVQSTEDDQNMVPDTQEQFLDNTKQAPSILGNIQEQSHCSYNTNIVFKKYAYLKNDENICCEAKYRVDCENCTPLNPFFKTLFYGLKLNQPHNSAVIYPIMFLCRRLIFAFVIIFGTRIPFYSVAILMGSCIVMLAFAAIENPMKSRLIFWQHIFNECATYLILIQLSLFTGLPLKKILTSYFGWTLILTVLLIFILNFCIMAYIAICYIKRQIKRYLLLKNKKAQIINGSDKDISDRLVDLDSSKEKQLLKGQNEEIEVKIDDLEKFNNENYDPLTKDLVPYEGIHPQHRNSNYQLFTQTNGSEIPQINNIQLDGEIGENNLNYQSSDPQLTQDGQNECFSPINTVKPFTSIRTLSEKQGANQKELSLNRNLNLISTENKTENQKSTEELEAQHADSPTNARQNKYLPQQQVNQVQELPTIQEEASNLRIKEEIICIQKTDEILEMKSDEDQIDDKKSNQIDRDQEIISPNLHEAINILNLGNDKETHIIENKGEKAQEEESTNNEKTQLSPNNTYASLFGKIKSIFAPVKKEILQQKSEEISNIENQVSQVPNKESLKEEIKESELLNKEDSCTLPSILPIATNVSPKKFIDSIGSNLDEDCLEDEEKKQKVEIENQTLFQNGHQDSATKMPETGAISTYPIGDFQAASESIIDIKSDTMIGGLPSIIPMSKKSTMAISKFTDIEDVKNASNTDSHDKTVEKLQAQNDPNLQSPTLRQQEEERIKENLLQTQVDPLVQRNVQDPLLRQRSKSAELSEVSFESQNAAKEKNKQKQFRSNRLQNENLENSNPSRNHEQDSDCKSSDSKVSGGQLNTMDPKTDSKEFSLFTKSSPNLNLKSMYSKNGFKNKLEKSDGILPGSSKFIGMEKSGQNSNLWYEQKDTDQPNFAPKMRNSSVGSAKSVSENSENLPDINQRDSLPRQSVDKDSPPKMLEAIKEKVLGSLLKTAENEKALDPKQALDSRIKKVMSKMKKGKSNKKGLFVSQDKTADDAIPAIDFTKSLERDKANKKSRKQSTSSGGGSTSRKAKQLSRGASAVIMDDLPEFKRKANDYEEAIPDNHAFFKKGKMSKKRKQVVLDSYGVSNAKVQQSKEKPASKPKRSKSFRGALETGSGGFKRKDSMKPQGLQLDQPSVFEELDRKRKTKGNALDLTQPNFFSQRQSPEFDSEVMIKEKVRPKKLAPLEQTPRSSKFSLQFNPQKDKDSQDGDKQEVDLMAETMY